MKCKVTLKPLGIECDADIFLESDARLWETEVYMCVMLEPQEYINIRGKGGIETVWYSNEKLFEVGSVKGTSENIVLYSTTIDKRYAEQKSKEICDSEIRPISRREETDTVSLHKQICEQMTSTYIRKNNDYGNAFANLRNEIPNAILVRLYDKYSRLKTLMSGEKQMVNDESIDDTLLDLANYCILELIERKLERGDK